MDEPQMPEDELMSLQMIKWFEEFGDSNGHRTFRPSNAELKQLCVTARAAHALEQKLIDALDSNENLDHSNKTLREELKQEQEKRHDWAKLKEEVRIAIEAFTDPEGNMPADTGEFRDLKRVLGKL